MNLSWSIGHSIGSCLGRQVYTQARRRVPSTRVCAASVCTPMLPGARCWLRYLPLVMLWCGTRWPTASAFVLSPTRALMTGARRHTQAHTRTQYRPVSRVAVRSAASAAHVALRDDGVHKLNVSVYIEHTDRYNVVYHSNYLMFISRAIQQLVGRHATVRADNFRFKAPARLGHDITVAVKPKQNPKALEGGPYHTFAVTLHDSDSPRDVYITADVTVQTLTGDQSGTVPMDKPMMEVVLNPDHVMRTTVWFDELNANEMLRPHAVLSIFERARTSTLGGPTELESLVKNDGVMFVIAKLDDYRFDPSVSVAVGDTLEVLGWFKMKGDSISNCHQVIVDRDAEGNPRIVAQGIMTLACVDAVTGKLRPVPQHFKFGDRLIAAAEETPDAMAVKKE